MANEIFMDIPVVDNMAKEFQEIGTILGDVNKELAECMEILNNTAYTGKVGGTAIKRYVESLQPVIVDLAEKSIEISGDLSTSIQAYHRGDVLGSTRFY